MLGYMDLYNSIANPKEDNFVIYDNLRVMNLDGEYVLPLLYVEATDDSATESGDDPAEFTLHRSGDAANAVNRRCHDWWYRHRGERLFSGKQEHHDSCRCRVCLVCRHAHRRQAG